MTTKRLFLSLLLGFPFLPACAMISSPHLKEGRIDFSSPSGNNVQLARKYVPARWHNLDAVTSIVRKTYLRPGVDLKQCAGKESVQEIISASDEKTMADVLNGVLQKCLDRYSFYKPSIEVEREQDGQWLANVGIEFTEVLADGGRINIIVSGVAPGGPAEAAGFMEGDVVLGVGDVLLNSADAATRALAGNIGDPVTIAILRDGKMHLLIFARRQFDVIPISAYVFPGGIAYAKLDEVSARAAAWTEIALTKMDAGNGAKALILDFRNNSGGREIFSAACIVSLFTNDPLYRVATLQSRMGENVVWARECKKIFREWQWGEFARFVNEKKLVVLVNENTAFIAELIVADLQQLDAMVIGTKTYKNGSVYTVFTAKDDNGLIGELHLITDLVLAGEKKQPIEGIGVVPDVGVSAGDFSESLFLSERVPNPERDSQLRKAIELLSAE